ncbi:MAG: hypothetical protein DME85_13990 [Verrucomicrobia bacterium]|nr:MAG: hypothetical protein DME85_13990 [Verrucomicrobiota bacterium]
MLLNEFLKEHRKVEKLEETATQQAKQIKALTTALKEQDAKIQKVSAHLETTKPAAQVVVSNQPPRFSPRGGCCFEFCGWHGPL